MIYYIKGQIVDVGTESVVLDNHGVGYEIYTTGRVLQDLVRQGLSETLLYTHLQIREDEWVLFGFPDRSDIRVFRQLLSVSGVGPKLALSILSNTTTDAIRRAVVQEQPDFLARIPGLGKKTAQKVVLHLQGKITEPAGGGIADLHNSDYEVVEALTALGYSIVQAQTAVQSLPKNTPDDVEEKLRLALQSLA